MSATNLTALGASAGSVSASATSTGSGGRVSSSTATRRGHGELRRLGLTPRSDVEVAQVPAPAAWPTAGVEEGAPVLARQRRMYANDTPVQLAMSYLRWTSPQSTALASTDPGPRGIYSRLADLGHAPDTYTETARVRPPDDDEAQFLRMDPDQRVVTIQRTTRTAAGRIVEVNQITLPAHQWELVYEWSAE